MKMGKSFRKKNYKRGSKNLSFGKTGKSKKKLQKGSFDEKRKKFKYIQRSKESEETQRRQKFVEDKYRQHAFNIKSEVESDVEQEEENSYEKLLSVLTQNKKDKGSGKAIESSSDSEYGSDQYEITHSQSDVSDDQQSVENKEECISFEIVNQNMIHNASEKDEIENNEEQIYSETESSSGDEEIECKKDPFTVHLDKELSQEHVENLLQNPPKVKVFSRNWDILGNLKVEISNSGRLENKNKSKNKAKKLKLLSEDEDFACEGTVPMLIKFSNLDLCDHYVKSQLVSNIIESKPDQQTLSELQCELFSVLNNYQDLYFPQRNFDNAEEIRFVYCLHALNHMLKTRSRIIHHNAKLANEKVKKLIPDSYRDQGLIRPKILVILPLKSAAFNTVEILISLLFGTKSEAARKDSSVRNYKRFLEEFTGDTIKFPKTKPKPADYEKTFSGNSDDSFRLGISLTKKCMKLYQDFYSSDIILASPLGLRMIVGAPGDAEREFDFLNSIEILILDQTEIFLAQNWDHFIHVLDHLHLQPQSVQNTDFSRVRHWCLNGLSKFYRQTLLFASHELPEFRAVFNHKCLNYRGKVKVTNPIEIGSIRNIATQIPQIFYKIDVPSIKESFDIRFKYFTTEVLPQFKGPSMAHCMIYVPSYFDFVRLRNYMKIENINFCQICEYTKENKIARARDMFYHSAAHFLLYSERAHFFRRTRIKGIRHLIMYQPPYWPNFYSEIINLMQVGYQNPRDGLESSMSITVLYTKYDILQVANIIGTERAAEILQSVKVSHMFTTTCD